MGGFAWRQVREPLGSALGMLGKGSLQGFPATNESRYLQHDAVVAVFYGVRDR